MNTVAKKIITDGDMSADVSFTLETSQIFGAAIQAIYTGSPVGTLKLQASCDDVPFAADVVNWTDISGASTAISAAGNTFYNVENVFYKWVRVFYDFTSGTGSLNVTYNGKG